MFGSEPIERIDQRGVGIGGEARPDVSVVVLEPGLHGGIVIVR
jgi:hypothetical protein